MGLETIVFQQEQEMKNEEKKAMIHARAQAQVERENHDIRMEQTRTLAKEKTKAAVEVGKMKSKLMWETIGKFMKNEDNMLLNTAYYTSGVIIAGIVAYKVMGEAVRQVAAKTTRPNLGTICCSVLNCSF